MESMYWKKGRGFYRDLTRIIAPPAIYTVVAAGSLCRPALLR